MADGSQVARLIRYRKVSIHVSLPAQSFTQRVSTQVSLLSLPHLVPADRHGDRQTDRQDVCKTGEHTGIAVFGTTSLPLSWMDTYGASL